MNNFGFIIPALSFITVSTVLFFSKIISKNVSPPSSMRQNRLVNFLFRYGRRVVYALALAGAYVLYHSVVFSHPTSASSLSVLMRYFGFTALFILYVVFLPGLFLTFFPRFFLNSSLVHIRRSLGVSVFFFAALHGSIGYFYNLSGNISSLVFLSQRNQLALAASSCAFIILSLLTLTSLDRAVRFLGTVKWKMLHRFVYVAGLLVVLHAFLIGSHFTNPMAVLPLIVNYVSLTIIFLEVAATVKRRLQITGGFWMKQNIFLWILLSVLVIVGTCGSYIGVTTRYDPHAKHRKGYSKNYALNVKTNPEKIIPGQPVELTFSVTDKRSGRILKKYQVSQTKLMHVIVLRHDLTFYDHIHPEYNNDGLFTIKTTFPSEGKYNLYVDYSPPDFYENLSIATAQTAQAPVRQEAQLTTDANATKIFEKKYKITLSPKGPYKINDTVDITYTLEDDKTGKPIDNLETYLGAFGHMAAVSEDLSVFTHVHPLNAPLSPSDPGGPQVRFSTFFPKAGTYKFFTQFKHGGNVFVTDFTVEAK